MSRTTTELGHALDGVAITRTYVLQQSRLAAKEEDMSEHDELDFLGDDFDIKTESEKAGDGDYTPIPIKWYDARIVACELKDNQAGTGKYVEVRVDIEGPDYVGRVLFDRITVKHDTSEKAVEIGTAKFSQLCVSAGFSQRPKRLTELLGKPVAVKPKTEKSKEYGDKSVPAAYAKGGAATPANAPTNSNDADIPF